MNAMYRSVIPSLFLILALTNGVGAEEGQFTVLTFNVFVGFDHGRALDRTAEWTKGINPDVAAWQELVGWDEERLQRAAPKWNHCHAVTLKGGGYNIGLTSKTPITVVERRTEGFHHGYLHCRTADIDFIVCHLWPAGRQYQLKEATQIRDLVNRLVKEGSEVLVLGDFNAHSSTDADWIHGQEPLLLRRSPDDSKRAPEDRFIVGNRWNFDVMNTIFQAPLYDIVRAEFDKLFPTPSNEEKLQLGTFPTRILPISKTADLQSGLLERVDFILATPSLAERTLSAEVGRDNDVLDALSDHYPVIATFGSKAKKQTANQAVNPSGGSCGF